MRRVLTALAVSVLPCVAAAQTSPVSEAFRKNAQEVSRNLIAAAEEMRGPGVSREPPEARAHRHQIGALGVADQLGADGAGGRAVLVTSVSIAVIRVATLTDSS